MSSLADQTQLEEVLLRPHGDKTKRLPTTVEQFKIREVRELAVLSFNSVCTWLNEYEGTAFCATYTKQHYLKVLTPFFHLLPKRKVNTLIRRLEG